MIKKCSCKHKGQDILHGEGKRVFNEVKAEDTSNQKHRCTACGITKRLPI